jgi:hypothetical protein
MRSKVQIARAISAVTLVFAFAFVGCSSLNREGPKSTCVELEDGKRNDCAEGIIASCTGGTMIYEVCTNDDADGGTSAEKICTASWQVSGAYSCSRPVARGDCLPGVSSACEQCLRSNCSAQFEECLKDTTCAGSCSGTFADALTSCLNSSPCFTRADGGSNLICAFDSAGRLR